MNEVVIKPSGVKPLVVENITFLPADDCVLTNYEFEKARIELNETEEKRNACLQDLKQRLAEDKTFKYRTDESYLLRFLRVRKYDCEKAYKTIHDFYTVRKKNPEVFTLPPNLESLLNLGYYTCLPYADEQGRLLFRVDFEKWNTSEVSFTDILRLMIIISDITTINPKVQINGIVGIWDMKGMSSSHFAQFLSPGRLMLFFRILQGCYPWRMKMIIGVNCGSLSRMFYKAVRPLVRTKIIERVILLGSDMSELHEHLNPAILPEQFGGKLENNECSNTQFVMNNFDYLNFERSFSYQNSD